MTTIKCAAGCGNDVEVIPGDEGMDHLCDTCAPEQCKRASCTRREEQMRARIAELEDALRVSRDELNSVLNGKYSGNAYQAIAKIKEVLGGE